MATRRSSKSSDKSKSKGSSRRSRSSKKDEQKEEKAKPKANGKQHMFSRGASSHDSEKEEKKGQYRGGGQKEFSPDNIFRYFIPASELQQPKEIMILEPDCINAWQHHFKDNGRWGNWETCPRLTGVKDDDGNPVNCPLCDKDDNVTTGLLGLYTILDVTGWDTDKGHRMSIKILPAKSELVAKLERRRIRLEKDGLNGLEGAIFTVVRDTAQSDNCGNDWQYEETVDLQEFLEEHLEEVVGQLDWFPEGWFYEGEEEDDREYFLGPFDWMAILDPKSPEELAKRLGATGYSDDDDSNYNDDTGADDDDPGY